MDEAVRKKVLRKIHYGLFVVTSATDDLKESASGTVNWLTQVSFKPPAVAVGIKKDSGLWHILSKTGKFAVSVLAKDQKSVAQEFFKGPKYEDGKMGGFEVFLGKTGCPILKSCAGAFECKVLKHVDFGGDHDLFVGEVVEVHLVDDKEPLALLETGWFYGG